MLSPFLLRVSCGYLLSKKVTLAPTNGTPGAPEIGIATASEDYQVITAREHASLPGAMRSVVCDELCVERRCGVWSDGARLDGANTSCCGVGRLKPFLTCTPFLYCI